MLGIGDSDHLKSPGFGKLYVHANAPPIYSKDAQKSQMSHPPNPASYFTRLP
jgi:hypothetical protein